MTPSEFSGFLGGSLNMVPAYVGYMLANALTNFTRGWVMEQGQAVAAIDNVNLVLGNIKPKHQERYDLSQKGLTNFINDFYSYKLNAQGKPDSPLGSHVNCNSAGGILEGGYLGFAGLQYPHIPLKGERLVAFLSDGAFEEQIGTDWAARWWRAEDCGLVAPIMIANGRRIDQRTSIAQEGGSKWLEEHLKLNDFEPLVFDGRDPAAFAWTIIEQERLLQKHSQNLHSVNNYKIKIPYGIAVAPKGAGFYNEGTNYAHNLPLVENPSDNQLAADRFNVSSQKLFVPQDQLKTAIKLFANHKQSGRKLEKDNPIANRDVSLKKSPQLKFQSDFKKSFRAMDAIDETFLAIIKSNPHLRSRVGNPDEMNSNRMGNTLEFCSAKPESGIEESTLGNVITALNEEAVCAAALGNKGGINIVINYEAFAMKMFGGLRQEVTFSKQQKDAGRPAKWLSVPIILTSNTWENSKNELSHQDPSLAESMLGETSDISRVLFVADCNSVAVCLAKCYQTQGQIWTIVASKNPTQLFFNHQEAEKLITDGAILVNGGYLPNKAKIALIAIGSYQLEEILKASQRLSEQKIAHIISYIAEPGKFRNPRNLDEQKHLAKKLVLEKILPKNIEHILIVSHTRPEIILGILQPLWQGRKSVRAIGFINCGGTLEVDDMLCVNQCSWAHIVQNVKVILGIKSDKLLSKVEQQALNGKVSPDGVITKI
jgi:phosphoketolase